MRKAKISIISLVIALLCMSAFGLVACNKSHGNDPGQNVEVVLDKSSIELDLHESALLTATASDGGAITWSSENEGVATVENGLVKSVADGITDIIARSGKEEARCSVTVTDSGTAPRLVLDYSEISIGKDQSFTVGAAVLYKGQAISESFAAEWAYADGAATDVLSFTTEYGAATLIGLKYGETSLTASTTVWGIPLAAKLDVTICNADITFEISNLSAVKGGYVAKFATIERMGYATEITPAVTVLNKGETVESPEIAWSSDNSGIAEVDASGKITARSSGSAVVTGRYNIGGEDYAVCKISVVVVNILSGNVGYADTLPSGGDEITVSCDGKTVTPDANGDYEIDLTVGAKTIEYTSKYYMPIAKTLDVGSDALAAEDVRFTTLMTGKSVDIDGATVPARRGFHVSATMTAYGFYDNQPGFSVNVNDKQYFVMAVVDDLGWNESVEICIVYDNVVYHTYLAELHSKILVNEPYFYGLTYNDGKYVIMLKDRVFDFDANTGYKIGSNPTEIAKDFELFDDEYPKTIGICAPKNNGTFADVSFITETADTMIIPPDGRVDIDKRVAGSENFTVSAKVSATKLGYINQPGFTIKAGGKTYLLTIGVDDWASHRDWELGIYDGENWYGKWFCNGGEAVLPNMEYLFELSFANGKYFVKAHDKTFEFDSNTEFAQHGNDSVKIKAPAVLFDDTPKTFGVGSSRAAVYKDIKFESDLALSIDRTSAQIRVGDTHAIIVTAIKDGMNCEIAWSSSDGTVATVDANGVVTAKNKGTTTITAQAEGERVSCIITVVIDDVKLNVTGAGILPDGNDYKTTVAVNIPQGNTEYVASVTAAVSVTVNGTAVPDAQIQWNSDDTDIATVAGGVITARAVGVANITGSYTTDKNETTIFTVKVSVVYVATGSVGYTDTLPHAGDEIVITCGDIKTTADADGNYAIGLSQGENTLEFTGKYYEKVTKKVTFANGVTIDKTTFTALQSGKSVDIDGATFDAGFIVSAKVSATKLGYINQPGFTIKAGGKTYLLTIGVDDWASHRDWELGIYDGENWYGKWFCNGGEAVSPNMEYLFELSFANGKYSVKAHDKWFEFDNTAEFTKLGDSSVKLSAPALFDNSEKTIGIGTHTTATYKEIFVSESTDTVLLLNGSADIDNATVAANGSFTVSAKVTSTKLGYFNQPGFTINADGKTYLLTIGVDDWASHKDWELGIYDGENWYSKWFCTGTEVVLPYTEYLYELSFENGKYSVKAHDKTFEFDSSTKFAKQGDPSVKLSATALFDNSEKTIGLGASGSTAIYSNVTFTIE